MPSPFSTIAAAAKDTIAQLGVGLTVVVREADVVQPRDTYPIAIVTMGDEDDDRELDTTGGPTDADQGDIGKAYPIGVSIYREKLGAIAADDANPDLVHRAQQRLGRARPFPALPTVYRGILVRNAAWERQEFVKGVEVSRFAVIFHNAESRTGS